jgi:hypothetical protein
MSACNKRRFPAMSRVISRGFAQAPRRKSTKNAPTIVGNEGLALWEYFIHLSVWKAEGHIAQ